MTRFWPNAHAFITGAGSGIGAATAIALAKAGVRVSIAGRRMVALKATAALLGDRAGAVVAIDVTDAAAVTKGVAQIEAGAGPIDILVNNAGKAASAPFEKTDTALWSDMLASNLSSVFLVTHSVLPGMAQRGRGRVINVASTAGLTGYAYVSAYVAAKHGVVGLTRELALEYARRGVTVNAICPGYTDTPLVADAAANIVAKTGAASKRRARRSQESIQCSGW